MSLSTLFYSVLSSALNYFYSAFLERQGGGRGAWLLDTVLYIAVDTVHTFIQGSRHGFVTARFF